MVAIPLLTSCFEISAEEAGAGLLSPGGVDKTGAATCGAIVWVKTSAGSSAALKNSGGTETGGGTAGVGGTADAASVKDAAASSDLTAVADEILVPRSPGVAMSAIRFVGFKIGISVDDAAMGSLSPVGVGRTGFRTSGLALDVGPTLVWSGAAFKGPGGIETCGERRGPGGSVGAIFVDEAATGSNLPGRVESGETVSDSSPTACSGTSSKNAGNGAVSKILPLGSGTTPAGTAGTSGVPFREELDDFDPLFVLPFVATLPRSIAPTTFGLADVSGVLPVAAAKAVENFPDG
jgi:hypothetical protein